MTPYRTKVAWLSSIKAPAKQQIHSIHRACVRNDRPAAPELPGDFENMRAAAQPFLITENKVPVDRFGKRDHLRIGQSDLALVYCRLIQPDALRHLFAPHTAEEC